jgi:hypothetical protein
MASICSSFKLIYIYSEKLHEFLGSELEAAPMPNCNNVSVN